MNPSVLSPFIPLLTAAVGIDALTLLDVDPQDPPLAALRIAAVTTRTMTAAALRRHPTPGRPAGVAAGHQAPC